MKKFINNVCLLMTLIVNSCDKSNFIEEKNYIYSICIGEFKSFTDAYNFKSKLSKDIIDSVFVKTVSNNYLLLFSRYKSSYEAGQRAYNLYSENLIKNYKIVKQEETVNDLFINIPFVADYMGRPSIYNFNLLTKNIKPLWSRWGRKVVSINRSYDRKKIFVITALSYNKRDSFPFIKDARLFLYDTEQETFDEIFFFGNGIQIYNYWETIDTFKVNFTYSDSIKSEIIIQNIYSFNIDGTLTNKRDRIFNLIKDGFPKPPLVKPIMISPKGNYHIRNVKENHEGYIYLRDVSKNAEMMIFSNIGFLNNIIWTNDEKYAFITISLIEQNMKNQLIIVDTEEKKVKDKFFISKEQDLLVHGNFLFFEEQNYNNKQITVYDLSKNKVFYRMQLLNGSGINSLIN